MSSIIGNVSAVPKPVSTIGWLSTYANGIVTGSVDGSMTPSASARRRCRSHSPTGAALAVAAAEEAAAEGAPLGDELPVEVELHAARSSAALPRPATSVVRRVDRTAVDRHVLLPADSWILKVGRGWGIRHFE